MTPRMTPEPLRFSVIVASRHRPTWLKRCLKAVSQLDHPAFEIVVVADKASLESIDGTGMKLVPFADANLASARNAGIAVSGGDYCAFIDDDAVPEPLWLYHMQDTFRQTDAVAAVGYVRGRNGISFQSKVASIDVEAETHVEATLDDPGIPTLIPGRALKLVGTNMAVRRDICAELGGFDESYRYFLEDTDLSLRIANAGHAMAVAPLAEVHHAFAPSSRRTNLRAPTDLFDIGRSSAVYLRRHYGGNVDMIYRRIQARERTRMLRHMVNGSCEPRDVSRRLASLKDGWTDGTTATLTDPALQVGPQSFAPFEPMTGPHRVVSSCMFLRRRKARRMAERFAEKGHRVSLFSFSLTPARHHVGYSVSGIWYQSGGLFGRSVRNRTIFRWCRFAERSQEEIERVAKVRGISEKGSVRGRSMHAETGASVV